MPPTPDDLMSRQDFDLETLPWMDRTLAEIDAYVRGLELTGEERLQLSAQLHTWEQFGYAILPGAVEHELVDAYMQDVDELFANYKEHNVEINCDIAHIVPINTLEEEYVAQVRRFEDPYHLRLNNFHNYSIAAKKLSLHRNIVKFLHHLFREPSVVLQTLTFLKGSEQHLHQDFAFVPAHIPSQLTATWIALEDIHPDSGPLKYVPGSHAFPKFEWGDGIYRTPNSTRTDEEYHEYLEHIAKLRGLPVLSFSPKKGDVFVWHAALAHGGTAVVDRSLTRKAHVTHYSKASTHRYDFRRPDFEPERIELNGGFLFKSPVHPELEDIFKNGEKL